VGRFELLWTEPSEVAVTSRSIVEGIDVVGDIGDREMIRTAKSTPRVAAELGSLIGVNQGSAWPPSTHGHQHRIENELAMNGRLSGPADDQAGNIALDCGDGTSMEVGVPSSLL
jgi:hypothetical protein